MGVINTKYEIKDRVIIYEPSSAKLLEGIINGASATTFKDTAYITYNVITSIGNIMGLPEALIFKDRGSIIDWATNLATSKVHKLGDID